MKIFKQSGKPLFILALAGALVPLAPLTQAAILEEVVVTATKRQENLQDVGISVTAMSGEQTDALGLNSTQEIVAQVPSLQVQSFTPAFTTFNLRGISQNNFQDNLEAPVAVYFDDLYIGSMNALNMQMFDMANTEVLRGPQGTLFGRNATGGLIHFKPKKADDDELNGYVRASFGERSHQVLEAGVGGGISDGVRARLSLRSEESDPYIEGGTVSVAGPIGLTGTGRDAGGQDAIVVRANIQMDLSESTLLDLGIQRSEDDDVGTGQYVIRFADAAPDTLFGQNVTPVLTGDVHRHFSSVTSNGFDREATVYSVKLSHDFDSGLEFNYVGGYQELEKLYREDAGGGLVFFPFSTEADYEQTSHELRLSGSSDTMKWQTGLFFMDIDYIGQAITGGPAIIGDPTGEVIQDTVLQSENWSVFGELEYDFSDSLTLIAGLRWSQDDKTADFTNTARNFSAPGAPADGAVLFDLQSEIAASTNPAHAGVDSIDYGDWAGRLQLNYQVEDTLVYGAINRGIKGGNWSPSSAVSLDDFRHDEEVLTAFELGYKATVLDGSARLNAAVFYYDYEDYQAFSLTGGTPQVTNSDATVQGGEVEFVYFPNDNWDINMGLAFLDSEVDFVPGVIPGSGNSNVELPQAPGLSLNALVRYNMEIGEGNLALQIDGNWNGDQFLEGSNAEASLQDAYSVLNLRATYSVNNWTASIWGKNVTDEEYLLYNLDLGFIGFVEQVYAPPSQFGATLTLDF